MFRPREKSEELPARLDYRLKRKQKDRLVDSERNLQLYMQWRTFTDDENYHLQSCEANYIHLNSPRITVRFTSHNSPTQWSYISKACGTVSVGGGAYSSAQNPLWSYRRLVLSK